MKCFEQKSFWSWPLLYSNWIYFQSTFSFCAEIDPDKISEKKLCPVLQKSAFSNLFAYHLAWHFSWIYLKNSKPNDKKFKKRFCGWNVMYHFQRYFQNENIFLSLIDTIFTEQFHFENVRLSWRATRRSTSYRITAGLVHNESFSSIRLKRWI